MMQRAMTAFSGRALCIHLLWRDGSSPSATPLLFGLTCVGAEQPGANERGERLPWLGDQRDHPKKQRRGRLLPAVQNQVLVHQVGDHQVEQLAGPFREHAVAAGQQAKHWVGAPRSDGNG